MMIKFVKAPACAYSTSLRGLKTGVRQLLFGLSIAWVSAVACADELRYQTPPPELQALIDAPRGPEFRLGPQNKTALLLSIPNLPSISEVAQPELKLAGLRINPNMRAASRVNFSDGLSILDLASGKIEKVTGLPTHVKIADTAWSPNERWIAISLWTKGGVELWLVDVEEAHAQRLMSDKLNAITGPGFSWLHDSDQLIVRLRPRKQKPMLDNNVLEGPITQESRGGKLTQTRTFTDLLKTPKDADRLDWQLQAQLAIVNVNGAVKRFGPVAILSKALASPDGKLFLTTQLRRPYSYQLPMERFGQLVEVWNAQGKKIKTIADIPLRERLPNGADAVQAGPRNFGWRSDQPATLYWLEAQAGGDPEVHSRVHDVIMQQAAPFAAPAQKLMELAWRFSSIQWGNEGLALVTESWWKTKDTRTWRIAPGNPNGKPELLFSRKSEDQYSNPGSPLMSLNQFGRSVIRTTPDGQSIFMTGTGASPEGDRPFLDRLHLASGKTTRLWRSRPPYYEEVLGVLDEHASQIITSREAIEERPNLYIENLNPANPQVSVRTKAITAFLHPTPQMRGIQKRSLRYQRDDGVELSATLYLPPGYDPKRDGPRPMLMWAYPKDFKTAEAAAQVSGSPYRFNRINVQGPLVMLARGYTVLDGPTMPIIGEGRKEPNDTFIEQLKMDAEAAVEEVVKLGVADRHRIAIGGHSYGAFMAANLLAHTNLFSAGIARSGAYNRTLTPFGFQSEERTYWKAKDVYLEMSPFHFADEIDEPLLLIHGEDDNNPGTFPMQSERLYQALQGLGTPARLVMLPYESHIYRARESIMQMLWEQDQWLSRYVKNAKPLAGH